MHPTCLVARGVVLVAAALPMLLAPAPVGAQDESSASFIPVTDAMLEDPAPGDWLSWRRTPDGWGYSPLDQIDRDNVGTLRMVWSRGLTAGSQEGTPLAYDGVLYMPNPGDVIQAIDAVTGDLVWEYRRESPDDVEEYVGGLTTNRNIAIYGRHIIDTSVDNHVFALDAETGRLAWETAILDYRTNPARHSSGPIVAGGKVVSGRSRRVRHHRPRRRDGGRGLAAAHRPRPRRARRRDVGRHPLRGARPCRLVDGPELRSRPEPRLHRDVGHLAGPEVHARGGREPAPVPQLDARSRR